MVNEITSAQIDKTNRKLEKLARSLRNPILANRAASVALYGWVIENYDSEGGKVGGWTPLKPSTIREKERIGKTKMLVRTGHLRASLVPGYDQSNAWVASNVPYAVKHQEGDPDHNIPQRRILPNRSEVLKIGIKVYQFYVSKEVRATR
jgi:phage gpG-like protein